MIKIFLSENGVLNKIEQPQPGCWICLTNPNESEMALVSEHYSIDIDTLKAALDEEERSRIEIGDNYNMIIVNIPMIEQRKKEELYTTIPLSVILAKEAIITVCLTDTPILDAFMNGRVKDFYTHMKTRFVLQILYKNATLFLQFLHNIDKKSELVENKLHGSTQNSELIELLKLEKSLVYFTTALRSNEIVLEKLLRTENIKKYPEDTDLLEDVIIENKQAIEMANIYSGILSGTMDAFASVISNNLNIVMKFLAIITIVLSIPNIIFSAFGMNLDFSNMPLINSTWGFLYIILLTVVICIASAVYFMKKRMFK